MVEVVSGPTSHYRMNIRKQKMLLCPWKYRTSVSNSTIFPLVSRPFAEGLYTFEKIQFRAYIYSMCHSLPGTLRILLSKTEITPILEMRQIDIVIWLISGDLDSIRAPTLLLSILDDIQCLKMPGMPHTSVSSKSKGT